MYYINSTPNENGYYGNPQSFQAKNMIGLPDEFLNIYIESKGFVYLTLQNDQIIDVSTNYGALEQYNRENPVVEETAEQKREKAYQSLYIITYHNKSLTVDMANKLWQEYTAEGDNSKSAEISSLIAIAKHNIRLQYPD